MMDKNKEVQRIVIIKNFAKQYSMLLALFAIWILFSILTSGTFISVRNLSNLFLQTATVAIISVGMVLIMVSGNIDLSVGSLAGLSGGLAVLLMARYNQNSFVAILAALAIGLLVGVWQGYWIAYRYVPAMIGTLSSMMVLRGILIGITGGVTLGPANDTYKYLGQGYLPAPIGYIFAGIAIILLVYLNLMNRAARKKYNLQNESNARFGLKLAILCVGVMGYLGIMILYRGIPVAVFIMILLAILFTFIANNTKFGRHIYAIGGNKEAARFSGINIKKSIFVLYIIMGTLCGAAGVVFSARMNSGMPAAGTGFEMDAIAAAIIGGTSAVGGEGSVFGALVGALVMGSIDNGLSLLNVGVTFQYVIKGLVLLIAVAADVAGRANNE